jgi:hypothetical protein
VTRVELRPLLSLSCLDCFLRRRSLLVNIHTRFTIANSKQEMHRKIAQLQALAVCPKREPKLDHRTLALLRRLQSNIDRKIPSLEALSGVIHPPIQCASLPACTMSGWHSPPSFVEYQTPVARCTPTHPRKPRRCQQHQSCDQKAPDAMARCVYLLNVHSIYR